MLRILQILVIAGTTLLLLVTGVILILESGWATPPAKTKEEAFLHGSIGVEIMPLVAFQVLPDMFPDRFQPAGPAAGDWIDQFGFVRGNPESNYGLPLGFAVSNYQPKSGSPAPAAFVGFSCSLCHTAVIRTSEQDPGKIVYGMGSNALDLFAWVDALQGALLDEKRLTVDSIAKAYEAKFHKSLGATDKLMLTVWLNGARKALGPSMAKWDDPYDGPQLRDSRYMPNGPSRTQAFRELVRFYMDRPAATDRSYSKLPPVYRQADRVWAQNDGSVRNPVTRSVFAAMAAGATADNLVVPGIYQNLMNVVEYTKTLDGPRYAEIFPDHPIDAAKAGRGQAVYMRHCDSCHGHPDPATRAWVKGSRQGEIVPVAQAGTDPERVSYRHYDQLVDHLFLAIPEGSPIRPPRDDVRPGPFGTPESPRGYINAPMESVFSRVPYLHNGSVLTLAELINLEPRREVFYRGRNFYDPVKVGLESPDQPDDRHYYRFDTHVVGNSNKGHDFPWTFQGPGWNRPDLEDLLEYMKTF